MKAFILFSPAFLEWSLAIGRALQATAGGAALAGLATGPQSIAQRVAAAEGISVAPLARLDDLERCWIATPVRPGARQAHEARLGADIFQRLVIADRHLGRGFVSGGWTPESSLSRLAGNPESLERYLVGLLDYAFQQFESTRPDLVFCHTVATAPVLALALVAKHLKIPFAQLRHTRISNRVIIDTTPFDRLEPVRETFENHVLTGNLPPASRSAAETYLAAVRNAESAPDYLAYHSRRVRESLRPVRLLGNLLAALGSTLRESLRRQPRDLRRSADLARRLFELRAAVRTARLLQRGPFRPAGWRPQRSFAFFPLHVDPEASTMVQSPMHTDQLAVIEAIAKNLPDGMLLLVKEHLPMLGRRPPGFYRRLAQMPGVELASPFEQGTALVRDAALTAVISSTAGWEAVVFGRPALVIAYPPYAMINDGFVAAAELTGLGSAIRAALAAPPADERRLLAYVAAALDCSFECPTEVIWGNVAAETVTQHSQVLRSIVTRLRALARSEPADTPATARAV